MKRVADLTVRDMMHAAGLKAFAAREESRSGVYAFEQAKVALSPLQKRVFEANTAAWKFFQSKPP